MISKLCKFSTFSREFQKFFSITRTFFSHSRSEQFCKQNTHFYTAWSTHSFHAKSKVLFYYFLQNTINSWTVRGMYRVSIKTCNCIFSIRSTWNICQACTSPGQNSDHKLLQSGFGRFVCNTFGSPRFMVSQCQSLRCNFNNVRKDFRICSSIIIGSRGQICHRCLGLHGGEFQ